MSALQNDFITALTDLTPPGLTARIKPQYSNTGAIYYQDDDFQTVLGVSYSFQASYASFNLTEITTDEHAAIGARQCGSRPQGMSWHGWGHCDYAKGELRQVREGVARLLTLRGWGSNDEAAGSSYLTLTLVVRRPLDMPGDYDLVDYDFEDAISLATLDETQFYSIEHGVSQTAITLGADPTSWLV